jgi:hypothetical protein
VAGAPVQHRQRVAVEGAEAVLARFEQLRTAVPDEHRGPAGAGPAAARALREASLDWRPVAAVVHASARSVVIAGGDDGPVLALRALAAGVSTTVHDHGAAGAGLVLEGRVRYERFVRRDGATAVLESIHELAVGAVAWWSAPPDDLHRQAAGPDGAVELLLLAGPPVAGAAWADVTPPAGGLEAAVRQAFLDGDADPLRPWYADDALLDATVPHWRFQVRGRDALLDLLDAEELRKPERRLAQLRTTPTDAGLLVEVEQRSTEGGEDRWFREVHHLRCDGGLVVEHGVWCSGVADAEAVRQLADAPVERM